MVTTLLLATLQTFGGLTASPTDVYVRVVDVGPGLCTITEIPGPHYMVFDGGHWQGQRCIQAARDIVDGSTIDLMVISHSDADHLGDADAILAEFDVSEIVRVGTTRTSASWEDFDDAVAEEVQAGATEVNLQTQALNFGDFYELGDATVTLVGGWGQWSEPGLSTSERRNVVSIVVRLEYAGTAVLYTGDTVGRGINDPEDTCEHAERFMVENANVVRIESDVMIAPHHGADNGSSTCFIEAVDPDYVIFPAGSSFEHPRYNTARRYIRVGVARSNMYRTDLGDDEGEDEWRRGRIESCNDGRGDDGVEILLRANGTVDVAYRANSVGC